MSTLAETFPLLAPTSLAMPAAALEILALLVVVAVGTLCFLLGWMTPNEGAVVAAAILATLLLLSWMRFNQGRHPCFLFLSLLTLMQGGRLLTYCLGAEPSPLRIRNMVYVPFDLSREEAGVTLLCVALSAICVYAPCRWSYRPIAPPSDEPVRQYLPYLYLLFYGSLPFQFFKNYKYYEYAREHGGYALFYANHAAFASSIPLIVRLVALITPPAFLALFVFERNKKRLFVVTILYFAASILILLLGPRMGTFGMVVTLWYVAGIKSGKKSRVVLVLLVGVGLFLAADLFQSLREDPEALSTYTFAPLEFVTLQGNSLDVTEVAVKYRKIFAPYVGSYLWNEVQDAFVARDAQDYARGRRLSYDVTVFLSPTAFAQGFGTASSYIAEAYLIGGIAGVMLISLLIGGGINLMYRLSGSAMSLFVVATIVPEVIGMPRGQLLDWVSVLLRTAISVAILWLGWMAYRSLMWLKRAPRVSASDSGLYAS